MHRTSRPVIIAGVIGVVFAAIGYAGLCIGGDFGAFVGAALPGVMLGISILVILVAPNNDGSRQDRTDSETPLFKRNRRAG